MKYSYGIGNTRMSEIDPNKVDIRISVGKNVWADWFAGQYTQTQLMKRAARYLLRQARKLERED